jgi:uncharacterized protein YjbJ (UPF0337 family)
MPFGKEVQHASVWIPPARDAPGDLLRFPIKATAAALSLGAVAVILKKRRDRQHGRVEATLDGLRSGLSSLVAGASAGAHAATDHSVCNGRLCTFGRKFMAGKKDRAKGKANEAAGATRKKVGEVIGNDEMQAKGAVQELKGKGQGVVADVKEKLAGKSE